jgi:2-amino-4-hydroxy-6-hydroxymethyldihydropteridine diphosphokinase
VTRSVDAWVGLGANLGDPRGQVLAALDGLGALPQSRLVAASSLYASPPMGPPDQPDYINAVARLQTKLPPHELLTELQALEAGAGRVRTGQRWGPRLLDLDLLLWGERELMDDRLTLPHPGIAARAFVLLPLAELAPHLLIPGLGRVEELLARIDAGDVHALTAES